jgi:hypothetical protein
MFVPTHSECPAFPTVRRMEFALARLKKGVSAHVEQESQFHRMFATCQEKWLSQFEQLRARIEALEARLAPWMTDREAGPRLAVVPPHEDAA